MKQYITMSKIIKYDMYNFLEKGDYRFACITQLFEDFTIPNPLIEWFYNDKKTAKGNEFIKIYKEKSCIEIYDQSEAFADETISRFELNPDKRFIMTKENFLQILERWEELRVSRPDTILVVIHEDNHVSLETDPVIIKEYQDAGYAFDINKVES